MDKAAYIAMTGAMQSMNAQQGHANNLANVNTNGFKADWMQARSMPVFGEHFPSRAYAMTERPATNFAQGNLIETGRNLDISVTGPGWIAVQAPDGTEAYTREGGLQVDINGLLRTATGLPVLGNGGPIALPPASTITIGEDGSISVVGIGQTPEEIALIDRIKLVNPDPATLAKGVDGLVHLQPNQQTGEITIPPADANVNVQSGYLESSNVNAVEEMTSILSHSRQFELQVKIMTASDQNTELAARLLQVS